MTDIATVGERDRITLGKVIHTAAGYGNVGDGRQFKYKGISVKEAAVCNGIIRAGKRLAVVCFFR